MNVGYTRIKMVAKKIPKRDACYHKVKRAMPKSSAYRSGHIRYGKVGAKYYNIGSKKKWQEVTVSGSGSATIKLKGWINCKSSGPYGRKSHKSGGSYPACRPTMAQCKSAKGKPATRKKTSSKRVNWRR